ncbi:MAG: PilN domain-containing protein [Pseudomonadota bacterium]
MTRPSRLPVATEADLDQVLGYELDRLTPFAPDEIYYAGEVTGRDETRGMIDVALTYTARDRVDPLLHHIRSAGLPATRVSLLSANGTLADSNLLPSAKASTWTAGRRLAAGLMVTAIVLTALVWFNALSERTEKIAALEADLTQIRKQLIAAEDAAKPTGRPGFALAAHQVKSAAPSVLSVLAQLTDLLPDDTSLSGLEIEGADILLTGLAEEPAALIAILTDAPGFADPVFAAPITRASEVGKSRFVLAARLVERLTP